MIVTTLPIVHRLKQNEAIFTLHKCGDRFATGGLNGEMKIWDGAGNHLTTVKKHLGSVASVRFSRDGNFLASAGDDGFVHVFSVADWAPVHTVKHGVDATHVEWTSEHLLSADLNGVLVVTRVADWAELHRMKDQTESIIGLCASPDSHWIASYSEGSLILYRDLVQYKTATLDKGLVVESLNTRLSFAPNNRYLSVGLCTNQRSPSVDIFDSSLGRVFSLVGHVAPSEVTAFCPTAFKPVTKNGAEDAQGHYCIVAVASQDLSLSLWCTANPKPFLLLKNLTEAPVLDMFWDGCDLYVCSYDGLVKKISFGPGELGTPVADPAAEEEFSMPLTMRAMELAANSVEHSVEPAFKSETVHKFEYFINGSCLEEILNSEAARAPELPSVDPNEAPVKVSYEEAKPKRIQPKMLQDGKKAAVPVATASAGAGIVLFDTNIPDKLRLTKTVPFKCQAGIFTIELSEDASKLSVAREGKPFYTVTGAINKVAYNADYLVVYAAHVQVYSLKTGRLLMPYIFYRAAFMSLLDDRLLLVSTYGDFLVLGLQRPKPLTGKLPKTKGLTGVSLDHKYCILAQYGEEILYYSKHHGCWLALNPEFNSILTAAADYANGTDETLAYIECQFRNYVLVRDQKGIQGVARQLFGIARRQGRLDDAVAYKLAEALGCCRSVEFVKELLGLMSKEMFMHAFVENECEKYSL